MADLLPRHKPEPIPQITTVPEHLAKGTLKEVYESTKAALGVPWMGVVTMAFAHYPSFYRVLWDGLASVVRTEAFVNACEQLREKAEEQAGLLDPPGIVSRLQDAGYSEQEIADVLACNEVFFAGNMPYLLIATQALLLLEGHEWLTGSGAPVAEPQNVADRPILMEAHHASTDLSVLYEDIRTTLGLPFVNTDYRAFARWPSYFELAWRDLRPRIAGPDYERYVTSVHETAVQLAQGLPNPRSLTVAQLRKAAEENKQIGDAREVVRLFQWLLPGLALNVAFFRHQLTQLAVIMLLFGETWHHLQHGRHDVRVRGQGSGPALNDGLW